MIQDVRTRFYVFIRQAFRCNLLSLGNIGSSIDIKQSFLFILLIIIKSVAFITYLKFGCDDIDMT